MASPNVLLFDIMRHSLDSLVVNYG